MRKNLSLEAESKYSDWLAILFLSAEQKLTALLKPEHN
jgi:hypothetical protein